MNKIFVIVLLATFFSLSMANAAITRIPVDVSYNSATRLLTISAENLFFTRTTDETFTTQIYVIQTTEGDVINLQIALANMTTFCNQTLGYVDKYTSCELRNRDLESIFIEVNNTKQLYENCTGNLRSTEENETKCKDDLKYWQTTGKTMQACNLEVENAKQSADSTKWIFAVVALCIGAIGYHFLVKNKIGAKKPEGMNWPAGS
jgi:hypothetical protein